MVACTCESAGVRSRWSFAREKENGSQSAWACTGESRPVLGRMDLGCMGLEVATSRRPGPGELG